MTAGRRGRGAARVAALLAIALGAFAMPGLRIAQGKETRVPSGALHRVVAAPSTTRDAAAAAATGIPAPVARLLRASGLPLSSFGIDVRPIGDTPARDLFALNADQPFLL